MRQLRHWRSRGYSLACLVGLLVAILAIGCATSKTPSTRKPADAEIVNLASAGHTAFNRGDTKAATHLYRRALRRAQVIDEPLEIANSAYNLAASLSVLGQYDQARALLQEARREARRLEQPMTDALILEAKVAQLQGDDTTAARLAEQARQALGAAASNDQRVQISMIQAHLACERGDVPAARAALGSVAVLLPEPPSPVLAARQAQMNGCLALAEQAPEQAAGYFDREAALLRQSRRYWEMPSALERAGVAYERAGQNGSAAERYFRAARSLGARGETDAALRLLRERLLTVTKRAGDEDMHDRAMALLNTLKAKAKQ